jgi:hypothetical protein
MKRTLTFLAVVVVLAGCGGGGKPAATSTPQTGAVAFAACMRAHGFPGWPDPTSAGVFDKAKLRQLGLNLTRVRAIEDGPCKNLLPATAGSASPQTPQQIRTQVADALSFARCMRSHGVARFPDPTAEGQLTLEMVQAQGIDVHSSSVLQAVQTCLPASHGALTPEKVREALAKAGG